MPSYELAVSLTNETSGHRFSEWAEPIEDHLLTDEGAPDFGAIYRAAQREYGRCESSVYIDRAEGPPAKVGWFFVSRQQYEDARTDGPESYYLRGAWVTVRELVEPAQPARYQAVEIG